MRTSHRLGLVAGLALATPLLISGCTYTPSPAGTWGEGGEGKPQLVIDEQGGVGGTDGCNTIVSDWTSAASGIIFGEVLGTLMYCEGVDTWLLDMKTAVIRGDELHILDRDGTEIGSLKRQ